MVFIGVAAFAILLVRATYQSDFLSGATEVAQASSASVLSVDTSVVASSTASAASVTTAASTNVPSGPELPTLYIPSIGVDAHIENVGVAPDGTMSVPARLAYVGWYEYGTPIGDVGSAVIAGHVDNGLMFPAVFYNLKKLVIGNDIYVNAKDGTVLHFVVTDVSDYPLETAPREAIFHDDSGDRLIKLITCDRVLMPDGVYRYNNRVVVTAKLSA